MLDRKELFDVDLERLFLLDVWASESPQFGSLSNLKTVLALRLQEKISAQSLRHYLS